MALDTLVVFPASYDNQDDAIADYDAGHVAGGMSRSDLKDLGELLGAGQSGLVVIAATDMEAHIDAELKHAAKVTKKQLRADEKQLEKEIDDAATA